MMSKLEARKKIGEVQEDSGNAKLLKEIESISKALYLDDNKTNSRPSVSAPSNQSKSSGRSQLFDNSKSKVKSSSSNVEADKDKKSIWNWKPLKALSNVRSRKFNCCFSLQVHTVEGLPPSFDNLSLCVHWKRRDGELVTQPVKVIEGFAEFEGKLTHTCMVYGSRSGPHHSAKYEAKHFLLFVSVVGFRDLDLGKHRVDLTRLLPLTLEELGEEKSSGKWTTSFKLSGEAKGAMLNVSFGYTVVGDSPIPLGNSQAVAEPFNLKRTNSRVAKSVQKFDQSDGRITVRRAESLPGYLNQQRRASSKSAERVKDLHEVLPTSKSELSSQAPALNQNFADDKLPSSLDNKHELGVLTEHMNPVKSKIIPVSESCDENIENVCESHDFSVTEQGVELSQEEQDKPEQADVDAFAVSSVEDKVDGGFPISLEEGGKLPQQDAGDCSLKEELAVHGYKSKEDEMCSKESVMKELEVALSNVTNLETEALDSPEDEENDMEVEADNETNIHGASCGFDDVTESLANDFMDILGIERSPFGLSSESEPESPRERLLKEFEKEGGFSLFDFGTGSEDQIECDYNTSTVSEWGQFPEDFELASAIQAAEEEHQLETQAQYAKIRAKTLEDLETEALMRQWGLNDEAFKCSPPKNSAGFGSPIDFPPEEPLELPSLGEGLGPYLQTANGGFVRSMNPSLFKNAKNGGNLIMQVSSPVVVPAEMGSGITDILQQLASVGIEKLSIQANKLMPLEDITGKTMHQVAWEAANTLEGLERQTLLEQEVGIGQFAYDGQNIQTVRPSALKSSKLKSRMVENEMGSEYVSLEELAPLAMDKIEALSIEGLRVQSGMSDEDAPSNINAQSIGEVSAFRGKGLNVNGSLDLEGAAGLQLLDIQDNGDDIDGLMGLSLTLDEWMRLDSGDIGDEDEISERTSKILAAHHASSLEVIRGGTKGDRRRGEGSGRKGGLLGNNFTVALIVQLRDPLRNYESVGSPMLALIQVERVFVPPKPKIYCKVSEVRIQNDSDDESELLVKKKEVEEEVSEVEGVPQFCITEVQVAGLKTESGKKHWGTAAQQQSGSRWLLANGMGKSNKQPIKSKGAFTKPATSLTTKQRGDTLWSISSRLLGGRGK